MVRRQVRLIRKNPSLSNRIESESSDSNLEASQVPSKKETYDDVRSSNWLSPVPVNLSVSIQDMPINIRETLCAQRVIVRCFVAITRRGRRLHHFPLFEVALLSMM